MPRLPLLLLCAALGALADAAAAAPLETPLKNQAAVLSYEIEVPGAQGGKPMRHHIAVRTPVLARASGPMNLLGSDFTDSQKADMAEISAATQGDGDGVAAMLEANRLLETMLAACGADEGSAACSAARARYQAAEQAMADHGASLAKAQAQVRRRNEDDHRFLAFTAGEDGADCGAVQADYEQGGRKGGLRYPDPAVEYSELTACQTMAVVDRRDGALALQMSPATLKAGGVVVVDLARLAGAPGLRLGAMRMSVSLPLQPTAGPDVDYAGAKTVQANGLRYVFRWKLERN
jgi:hypothetical protein